MSYLSGGGLSSGTFSHHLDGHGDVIKLSGDIADKLRITQGRLDREASNARFQVELQPTRPSSDYSEVIYFPKRGGRETFPMPQEVKDKVRAAILSEADGSRKTKEEREAREKVLYAKFVAAYGIDKFVQDRADLAAQRRREEFVPAIPEAEMKKTIEALNALARRKEQWKKDNPEEAAAEEKAEVAAASRIERLRLERLEREGAAAYATKKAEEEAAAQKIRDREAATIEREARIVARAAAAKVIEEKKAREFADLAEKGRVLLAEKAAAKAAKDAEKAAAKAAKDAEKAAAKAVKDAAKAKKVAEAKAMKEATKAASEAAKAKRAADAKAAKDAKPSKSFK